tara:strand:- start:337 stop:519 length:183 start_codon:yes stop_codon:yes gene_type:complete
MSLIMTINLRELGEKLADNPEFFLENERFKTEDSKSPNNLGGLGCLDELIYCINYNWRKK